MFSEYTWDKINEWVKRGTGGGRRIQIELLGHKHERGDITAVITFMEWARDVSHPRPLTVTTKRFDPTDVEEVQIRINEALMRWELELYDHKLKDEDDE